MFQKSQKEKIRIGIDARFFGPKQKGLGRYVQKLVENLEQIDKNQSHSERSEESRGKSTGSFGRPSRPQDDKFKYEFVIFLRQENWSEYQPTKSNFKKVLADYQWYTLKEQILLPFKIKQEKVDLMHFPHFNAPIFYRKSFVMTIHDLILKRFPTRRASTLGPIKYWLKNLGYQIVISSAIKRSQRIIAVSDYTKQDILRYFRVKPDKIKVIYEGAASVRVGGRLSHSRPPTLKPYLLYVGNAYPHKNLERLVLAFEKLSKEKKDLRLVLVGELDYFYKRLQRDFAKIKNVIFTDFVTDEELVGLYQNASLYVFPSLCEGFGLPPLEAMAYQTPVVSSKASCLPEILGEAAVYFNPENVNEIADKIKQVLGDKELQKRLIVKGKEQIKKYSWRRMASEALRMYG